MTPEARGLAGQLGIHLDPECNTLPTASGAATQDSQMDAIRAAVIAKLPADVAYKPELVDQIVNKVCAAQKNPAATPTAAACPTGAASAGGIKLVKGDDVHLGRLPRCPASTSRSVSPT